MFAIGGLPALLLAWVRHGVTEPERWQKKEKVVSTWRIWQPFATLFSNALRRRTILNTFYMLASICGLWAGTVYVPAAVTALAEAAGRVGPQSAQLASTAAMLVAFATILGCLVMAVARGETRPPRRAGILFHANGVLHRADLWKGFLSRRGRPPLVLCLSVLSRFRRGEFCGLHTVAAGTISHRVPRKRICLLHLLLHDLRGGNHFLVGAGVQHFNRWERRSP